MRSLFFGLVLTVVGATAALAQTPAADRVAAQIAQLMQESVASAARSSSMARDLRDPLGSSQVLHKADELTRLNAISTVVGAIAASPAEAGAIVAAAVNAAPTLRNDIISAATTSYPAFAPGIFAAAGAPSAAAPIVAEPPPAPLPGAPPPPTAVAQAAQQPRAAAVTATRDDEPALRASGGGVEEIRDPLETINRGIFAFNDVLDRFLIRPLAYGYGYVTPEIAKQSIRNFLSNLRAPIRFANDVLQLESEDAAITGGRFLINTTIGVLGFLDIADMVGLEHHPADFGQTLHRYSVGPGPYIVIPVLGPSTLRDGVGIVADTFMDPLTYLLDTYPRLAVAGVEGVVKREALIKPLDELRAGSVDYYAALRAAYYQDRAVVLAKGNPQQNSAADDAFDSFE